MRPAVKWLAIAFALALAVVSVAVAQDASLSLKSGGIEFPDGTVQTSALPHRAAVAKTGQTQCFDSTGTGRACAGTGEDGEFQAGVGSPTPRFVDHGDGTVTDLLTGLTWLKDARCFDPGSNWPDWDDVLAWVDGLNAGSTACADYVAGTYADWRLPNVRELASVIDYGQANPAFPAGHPFVNVPWDTTGNSTYTFASSSVVPQMPTADDFRVVDSRDGKVRRSSSFDLQNVGAPTAWAVRGVTEGPVRVEDTGLRKDQCYASGGAATPCTGTGQDGELQAGLSWPTPRFTDHGDGTVTDELTGLMWLKHRDCLAGGLTWQEALDSVAAFNSTTVPCTEYTPQTYTDWRMPNVRELHSLYNYGFSTGQGNDAPWIGTGGSYCSSTSFVGDPSEFWYLEFGFLRPITRFAKSDAMFCRAWPVRGGLN